MLYGYLQHWEDGGGLNQNRNPETGVGSRWKVEQFGLRCIGLIIFLTEFS